MGQTIASQLARLDKIKHHYGPGTASQVEKILDRLANVRFRNAEALIRFHDALLFLRAFPQSVGVIRSAERLLAGICHEVERLRQDGVDLEPFEPENVSGIAGTTIEQNFTYEVASWLFARRGDQLRAEWDEEVQSRRLGAILPRFVPLLEDDALVEADTPYLKWLREAAGGSERDFAWLMRRFENLSLSQAEKTELFDALDLNLRWELSDSSASRTLSRRPVAEIFCHEAPLLRRNQVSLADEFAAPRAPMRKLSAREGEEILDMVREALTVRGRELYGTTRGDATSVWQSDVGRGVSIFLWGLPPPRRLPLRGYHAGFTLKNGVPINYIEGISLFAWMEVGFNTFYAYRDGETAWIYSRVLKLLHQLTGVTCISVYPYQLGQDNEEAIQSGAFWFYRKLGFRPGRPELLALTRKEEKRMTADAGYRVSKRNLRKLAAGHVFFELNERQSGLWDSFSTRNIGLAVQRRMAEAFDGDAKRMRSATASATAEALGTRLWGWNELELRAFENISLVLAMAPDVRKWSKQERRAALDVIRAKASADEVTYLRLMQRHLPMRDAFLRVGSNDPTGKAATA
jgi:hypothetical protein